MPRHIQLFLSIPLIPSILSILSIFALTAVCIPTTASAGCKNDKPIRSCKILADSPRASATDPRVKATIAVFERLESPFAALTGRDTGLVVLSDKARMGDGENAKPIPPAAYICAGAPPVVYVPWTLVSLVLIDKKYPVDFLAFVIGHELGHRANDFDHDGCQLAAFARPGKGVHEEELADKRSAFFTAVAGFSTRKIANAETVGRFLASEYNIRKFTIDKRKTALLSALQHMDSLEHLYQLSLSLAFSGDVQAASRLLAWSDELLRGKGVPLPELAVVRALVLMLQAAPNAPWLKAAKAPLDVSHLRCAPVFPGYSALAARPDQGAVLRAGDGDRKAALRALQRASKLLDEAALLGAPPLSIASARTCLAFYYGDTTAAATQHKLATALAKKIAPPAVVQALLANGALLSWQRDLLANPPPSNATKKSIASWGKRRGTKHQTYRANPTVVALAKAMTKLPNVPAGANAPPRRKCVKKTRAFSKLTFTAAALPLKSAVGTCPRGWTYAHSVPPKSSAAGASTGVTACRNPSQPGSTWSRVQLPALMSPAAAAVDVTMRTITEKYGTLPTLQQLICGCDELDNQGVNDRGETAWLASCSKLGFELAVVFTRGDGSTARIAIMD